jgi:tetratricopeptide (TPR) repeat protein/predicted Ser/Thr protein kinase
MGWLTREQLRGALLRKPPEMDLEAHLLRENLITPEQCAEALGTRSFYYCPSCRRRYDVEGALPGARYLCPRCRSALSEQAGEEAVAAQSLEVHREELPEAARKAAEDPDRLFHKFVKIELAGRGGMGAVWRCYDRELRRFVAVKFLEGAGENTAARFLREAKVAARLEHPCIARVYDSGSWKETPYIVMEFVEGRTLSSDLPWRDVLRLLAQAARALHYAHEQGIIHRDIKPENLMVTPAGEIVLLDFGLAREIESGHSLSAAGAVVGTPPYMSPEQIRGENHRVDARSDVYSLGATLYAALAGRPPFAGEAFAEVLRRVLQEDPAPVGRFARGIPWEIETIVGKAMEKEPHRRYPSAQELALDIERYLKGEPIQARPAGPVYRLQKQMRKRPALFSAAALAVFGGLLAGAYFWGAHLERLSELDRLLHEGRQKLDAGDLQGAHEALVKAHEISPQMAGAPLALAQAALVRQKEEKERLARREEESRVIEPYLRRIRDLQWTSRPADYREKIKQISEEGDRLILDHPSWAGAWLIAGWSRRLRGRTEGTLELYARTIQDLTRAVSLSESGRPEYLAESLIQRSLASSTRARSTPWMGFLVESGQIESGMVDSEAGKYIGAAEADLKKVETLGLAPLGLAFARANVLQLKGDLDGAIELLESSETSGAIEEVILLARCRFFGRSDSKMLRELEFMAEQSRLPAALDLAGLIHYSLGNLKAAQGYLTQSLEQFASSCMTLYHRGLSRAQAHDYRGAIEDYTAALRIVERYAPAYVFRAESLRRVGDGEGSLRDCQKAIDILPMHPKAYCVRGLVYLDRQELDAALGEFDRAIQLAPGHSWSYFHRARVHLARRDYAAAIEDNDRCLKLDPKCAPAWANRGVGWSKRSEEATDPAESLRRLREAEASMVKALECGGPGWAERAKVEGALGRLREKLKASNEH